jgi:phosphatidylserine/phosphatidylglycerophosphate/cardiolipin synthase-like enzyme
MRRVAPLLLLALAPPAAAWTEPWVAVGDDVRVIPDPEVEAALRLALVARARRSIDLATYDLRPDDEVAMPLATALRAAADRGVRVRIILAWSTEVLFDRSSRFGRMMVDPPTAIPIQLIVAGGPPLEDRGWGFLDSIHEKLLIIDGDVAMTTGRGIGAAYHRWLDTAFLLRGELPGQASQAFEGLWQELSERQRPFAGSLAWHQRPRRAAPVVRAPSLRVETARAVATLLSWLRTPRPPATLGRGRVLHFDLLHQLHQLSPTPAELDIDERVARLSDPVVSALVDRLLTAREVRISMLSTILHPLVREALLQAHARGADITLFINVATPSLGVGPAVIEPGGALWAAELPDLALLLDAGIRVRRFQINGDAPWVFVHRKLAIVDDTVIFGSHNLNLASSVTDDEVSFEIENPQLAAELRRLFDEDLAQHGLPIDPAMVRAERDRAGNRLVRWLSMSFLGYM